MSAFYSSQAYNNFINEITQQAGQKDNEEEQYQNEEAQAKEGSTMMGTEILAQTAPMVMQTIARVGGRIKSVVKAGIKVKNAVVNSINAVQSIPDKVQDLANLYDTLDEVGQRSMRQGREIAEQANARLKEIGTNALTDGREIAEQTGARLSEAGTNAVAEGRDVVDSAVSRGSEIVSDFKSEAQRFGKMPQERLNEISSNTKSFIDGKMADLKAKGREITPELQAKYERFSSLTDDKSPEGIAKLQSAYKDFTFANSPAKAVNAVSSTGKTAVSKLNPREQVAKLQSTLQEHTSKIENLVREKEDTIRSLTNIHNSKMQDLSQDRATLQRKLQFAETRQREIDTPRVPRYVAPEESAYRTGGSVRLPAMVEAPRPMGFGGSSLGWTNDYKPSIAGYKRDMAKIDSRLNELASQHTDALKRVNDFHDRNLVAPLAKIDEAKSSLESVGKSAVEAGQSAVASTTSKMATTFDDLLGTGRQALGSAMEHVAPALDIGFAGQSLNSLVHGEDRGNVGSQLNDANMVRHGGTSAYDAGKAVADRLAGKATSAVDEGLQAGKGVAVNAAKEAGSAVNEGLQAGKSVAVNAVKEAGSAIDEGLQAGKSVAINAAKEAGTAVSEAAGSVLGPVGELADVALMAYSLFSGISNIKSPPYIAPPPPQAINIVHQAGIT